MSRNFIQDQVLIDQLMLDSTEAFEELYHRYWYALYSYSYSKLHSPDQAKSIVKNLFVNLWEERKTLPLNFSVNTYLYTGLRKAVLNSITHQLQEPTEQSLPVVQEFEVNKLKDARTPVRIRVTERAMEPVTEPERKAPNYLSLETFRSIGTSFFALRTWKKALQTMMNF